MLVLGFLMLGCTSRGVLAPVVEPGWRMANTRSSGHVVSRGETLYSIAFRYDQDYRQLAALNHIAPPYIVRVGQVLKLNGSSYALFSSRSRTASRTFYPQRSRPIASAPSRQPIRPISRYVRWQWPAQGRLATTFAPEQGRKGIDIAGRAGQKIHAASGGVVAYAGSGLLGYGNLIIIKHNDQLLTAYGNNSRNLVREGQVVKRGQVIAEMGMVNRHYSGVHFEMRQSGRPVNPLYYLGRG